MSYDSDGQAPNSMWFYSVDARYPGGAWRIFCSVHQNWVASLGDMYPELNVALCAALLQATK